MRYCQFEGCSNTTEKGAYCSEHARKSRKKKKQINAYHHDNKSFYRTKAWQDVADFVYERENGCCQRCGRIWKASTSASYNTNQEERNAQT